jgi:hypothetical protein
MKHSLELLNPSGLWMLSALVPLVILYILKVQRQRLKVPSTWLWAAAQRDLLARSPFKRLTPQIPLFLQILGITFLALALSRPATRGRSIAGDHIAIILDTSASMSALDASGKTRMDLAKAAAAEAVQALAPGADAMVLEAARDARVASPLDRDTRRLRAAIHEVHAADVEGDLAPAVALAVDRLRQLGGSRRVMVFTDGALARPDALTGVSLPLEVVKVGTPVDNAGIVRIDIRSGTDPELKTDQLQAFVMVENFGERQRDLFVTMREQNASDVLASRRILLKPGERQPVVLTFNPASGDIGQGLILELNPKDGMPGDDVAYGRVPNGARLPVVLAAVAGSGGAPWLERALRSDPLVELLRAPGADPGAVGVPPGALVVLDGVCPAQIPANDLLIVNPPKGPCLGAEILAPVDNPAVTSWSNSDQRFRFLTLDGVHIAKASIVKPESGRQDLVHTREGSVVVDASAPGRSATIVSFDVGDSDWPLKASFVLFMRNVVELARAHRAHGVASAARAGEPLRLSLPPQITQVHVEGPGELKRDIPAKSGLAVMSETTRAGIYHASWQGPSPGSVAFAVNLTSERESDLKEKQLQLGGSTSATITSGDQMTDAHTEWTWLLAAIALALVLVDVWYLTRKPALPKLAEALRPRMPERGRS